MVIVKIMGGLGNQLFQYSAGRQLACILRTELKLDISWFRDQSVRKYSLSHFNVRENFASPEEVLKLTVVGEGFLRNLLRKLLGRTSNPIRKHVRERHYHFDPDIFRLHGDLYLNGYWQSEKYFKDIESVIREDLTFKNPLPPNDSEYAQLLANCNSVSLHVRRGDYVKGSSSNKIHALCDETYYHSSASFIGAKTKHPHFFIFSDDTYWVRANLSLPFPMTIIERDEPTQDFEDLRLMGFCKHHIIANSSFSWWGAWLNPDPGKIVVTPKRWFSKPDFSTKDLIPPGWIQL